MRPLKGGMLWKNSKKSGYTKLKIHLMAKVL
jgi:hypothetical protein